MSIYTATIKNKNNQEQKFRIEAANGEVRLMAYLNRDISSVYLPKEIDGNPITEIGQNCFNNHSEITEIEFPEELKKICSHAFKGCSKLEVLSLPDSVSEIEAYAFRECKGLKRIYLPASLKCLETGVFASCYLEKDAEVYINVGLETIKSGVFSSGGVALFATVFLPEGVENIENGAFEPGMNVQTTLSVKKGWFNGWPYGETIVDANGAQGRVIDIESIPNSDCMILDVDFNGEEKQVFFPFCTEEFSFKNEASNDFLKKRILLGIYKNAKSTYMDWQTRVLATEKTSYPAPKKKSEKILSFAAAKDEKLSAAYAWAQEEIKYFDLLVHVLTLKFDDNDLSWSEDENFLIALFYDDEEGEPLLRRFWKKESAVKYDYICNYKQLKEQAPNSVAIMLSNGIKLMENKL